MRCHGARPGPSPQPPEKARGTNRPLAQAPRPPRGYGSAGQGCHNAPGDVRLAVRAANVTRQLSMEHEGIVHKLCPRQVLCVHHKLVRFNPLTYRGETGALAGEAAHTPNPIANKAAATENTMVLRI